jgi:Integrase core domain
MWEADITHWPLAGGGHAEILNTIDDHSRLFLASCAFPTVKAADVVDVFGMAIELHGTPASLLCDNGAVFTATPRGGKVLLQAELDRLGVAAKNSRPYHPQTCGKVEGLHQTLKRYPARQAPAKTLAEPQAQLDAFVHYYNTTRPHRAWEGAPLAGLQPPGEGPTGSRGPSRHPTSVFRCRGTSQKAAEGIRTLDLLHGNWEGHRQPLIANQSDLQGFCGWRVGNVRRKYARIYPDMQRFGHFWPEVPESITSTSVTGTP